MDTVIGKPYIKAPEKPWRLGKRYRGAQVQEENAHRGEKLIRFSERCSVITTQLKSLLNIGLGTLIIFSTF